MKKIHFEYDKEAGQAVRDKILFLFGDYRIENRKEYLDLLTKGGFNYKIIKKAGHGVNHEQPDIVNEEIKSFLLNWQFVH